VITLAINPLIAGGVLVSTAVTDAAYVLFNAAVSARRRVVAANWSGIWYLLSAFAVISYTQNALYVLFAAAGSWLGAYASMTWLQRDDLPALSRRRRPPKNR
jgi:uncharacterized membrane protein YhaH (DUF805 family)